MAIVHRYITELENIENNRVFCNKKIATVSNVLIIGTFNPNNDSCLKVNNATWFYGRIKSNFWRYFPTALTGKSLHQSDGHVGHPQSWKNYCVDNKVVIIDLVKKINTQIVLANFGDKEVDTKINIDLDNVEIFDVDKAFKAISFDKVIYSLAWKDSQIVKLKKIRDIINRKLVSNGCIENENQIKYCITPSRNDAFEKWRIAFE